MPILKCKMCGGDLVITPDSTVCECEYCGSKQTVPVADDDKKIKLYDRANRLRYNCEFDKAAGVYENIIADFPVEAEAYWGLLLCKFGIEYVDSPSGRKVPTCHRSSFDSVMEDPDFEMVMENSDDDARAVYRAQAKEIEEIRKNIIEVSGREQPYDIFICYKETAKDGQRTLDSVLAQDIYDALTEKGYRVFFSRVTLEDKLGTEYEPYIFAALNSARLMLAFGTSYDNYNAVWVKNEWSRYLKLMEQDKSKHLIPCYKDIDSYDMPKEFAKLQAQNLGKVGATQDLLRGIEKILGNGQKSEASKETVYIPKDGSVSAESLLKRAFMFLEDKDWEQADSRFEQVLDADPENGKAYLGKLLVEVKLSRPEDLQSCSELFYQSGNYQKCIRFADQALAAQIRQYGQAREEQEKKRAREELLAAYNRKSKEIEGKRNEINKLKQRIQNINNKRKASKNSCLIQVVIGFCLIAFCFILFVVGADRNSSILILLGVIFIIAGIVCICKAAQRSSASEKKDTEKANVLRAVADEEENLRLLLREQAQLDTMMKKPDVTSEEITEQLKNAVAESIRTETVRTTESARKNKIITFGRYEQEHGIEPICWRVLKQEGGKALVISESGIDCRPYNAVQKDVTWESSDLRNWLNTDFYNAAFSKQEQEMIWASKVSASVNKKYNTTTGRDTWDKVFLLNVLDAEQYFSADNDRKCTPTVYAVAQGAAESDSCTVEGKASCWWWLQTLGKSLDHATLVRGDGSIRYDGMAVYGEDVCVRPAMWLDVGN